MLYSLIGLIVFMNVKASQANFEKSNPGHVFFYFCTPSKLYSLWNTYTSVRHFHAQGPKQHETSFKRLQPGRKEYFGAQRLRNVTLGCFPMLWRDMPAIPPGSGGEEQGYGYGKIYCWGIEHRWDLLGAGNKLLQCLQKEIFVAMVKGRDSICSCYYCYATHCSIHALSPMTHVSCSWRSSFKPDLFYPVFKPPSVRAICILLVAPLAPGQSKTGRISNTM